jgi:hypothetical protein
MGRRTVNKLLSLALCLSKPFTRVDCIFAVVFGTFLI